MPRVLIVRHSFYNVAWEECVLAFDMRSCLRQLWRLRYRFLGTLRCSSKGPRNVEGFLHFLWIICAAIEILKSVWSGALSGILGTFSSEIRLEITLTVVFSRWTLFTQLCSQRQNLSILSELAYFRNWFIQSHQFRRWNKSSLTFAASSATQN